MGMTKSTLLRINSGGGGSAGFGEAGGHISEALGAFETPVWSAIESGTHWSGFGQPDAEKVLHTNVLAFHISQAMMQAGAATMRSATLAFSALQVNMQGLDKYAKSFGSLIHEDGTVVWDDNNPNKKEPLYPEDTAKQVNLQYAVWQTLKLATVLDMSTKASLQTIYDQAPEVVDNARAAEQALQRNKQTFVDALDARQLIVDVAAGWQLVGNTLFGVGDLKAAGTRPLADFGIHNQISQLDKVIQSAIGVTKAGPLLNLFKLDVPMILADAIVLRSNAAAAGAATAGRVSAAELLKIPGRLAGGLGYALLAKDVFEYLVGKLAPDAYPTTHPVVDGDTREENGEHKIRGHVSDFGLSHIASTFYFTHGYGGGQYPEATIADIARAQRLGAVEQGQFDYVAEARELKADLQKWLDTHEDLDSQHPDRAYAAGLVAELDAALGR